MTKKYELKKYERKREIIIFGAAVAAAVAIALFFSLFACYCYSSCCFVAIEGISCVLESNFLRFFFVFLFQLRLITLYCLQWTFFFSQQYKFKLLFVFQLYADVFVVDLSLACCLRA